MLLLNAQKSQSNDPIVIEFYNKLFDAFRYSLQHFNQYQFEQEYNQFVKKLIEIIDFVDHNTDLKTHDGIIELQNSLHNVLDRLEQAYKLFMSGRAILDEVMDKEFPETIEFAEKIK